ncbi:MAG: hypothetical protein GX558_10030 [Clostridiales bacterium]|nr:hypothetical protein [Clostridiales bacterium]
MALLGGSAIGIDLGSERTRICLNGGVALSEPTAVLVSSANAQEVLAVGMEAAALSGRAAGQAELLSPVVAGAVADVDMAALLIVALTEKAAGRKKMFDKAALIAPVHGGLTRVERQAARSALAMTGARRIATVRESMAGALGAGLDAAAPKGQLILLLGGGVAEVAVISMHAVVAERAMRLGGQSLNQAIIDWFLREKGVLIGPRVAEQLKLDLGTALPCPDDGEYEAVLLKGRDGATGKPASVEIDQRDVQRALEWPIRQLVDGIRGALMGVPPELCADLTETGVTLLGGGSLLHGLAERLERETGLPVSSPECPDDAVALGLTRVAADDRLFRALVAAGAADDVG